MNGNRFGILQGRSWVNMRADSTAMGAILTGKRVSSRDLVKPASTKT